ncbi:protein cornichon homolog 1-like isoform X2 [Mercurialis annua]|uniref:protein cornichon homolog 1-like isoform X2 n=1 Tax=Mercurialis annua TaxID=3986 RepID=UPI00215F974A|nr:protein cornichon homolog 1-like isoform X2 [Mercurialis annua]
MVWDLIFSLLLLLLHFGLVAMIFYALLCLTDLEVDHMNPFEATAAVNAWILPEFVLQGVVCILFLLTRHWFLFLFVLPLTCYHLMKFWKREHLIDVTEVFRSLNYEKKCRLFKLGVYLISFSILMFRVVLAAFNIIKTADD